MAGVGGPVAGCTRSSCGLTAHTPLFCSVCLPYPDVSFMPTALNNCAMRRRSEGKIDVLDDRCRWFNETAMQLRTGKESSG